MINNASHASVSRLVAESGMCLDIVSDKALANVFCIKAILRLATKNRFCESSQRLIQPRLVRWASTHDFLFYIVKQAWSQRTSSGFYH
jgi:hypothetical protein